MRGDILHLECDVPETHFTFFPRIAAVPATIIEQLQTGAIWQSKIRDIEVAAVHCLLLFESQNAAVKINRFFHVRNVDRDVVDFADFQFSSSKD